MCVNREWVTNPERPAQLDRDLVSRKLNSLNRPVFSLISQDLQNTENVAIYIALFVFTNSALLAELA